MLLSFEVEAHIIIIDIYMYIIPIRYDSIPVPINFVNIGKKQTSMKI